MSKLQLLTRCARALQEFNLVGSDLALEVIADVSTTVLLSPKLHLQRTPRRGLGAWTASLPAHAFEVGPLCTLCSTLECTTVLLSPQLHLQHMLRRGLGAWAASPGSSPANAQSVWAAVHAVLMAGTGAAHSQPAGGQVWCMDVFSAPVQSWPSGDAGSQPGSAKLAGQLWVSLGACHELRRAWLHLRACLLVSRPSVALTGRVPRCRARVQVGTYPLASRLSVVGWRGLQFLCVGAGSGALGHSLTKWMVRHDLSMPSVPSTLSRPGNVWMSATHACCAPCALMPVQVSQHPSKEQQPCPCVGVCLFVCDAFHAVQGAS